MPQTTTENDTALRLMETVLREGRPMAAEYPLVFEKGARGRIETVEVDGTIASTCAWLARTLIAPGANLPIALVGSVATSSEHRGRGLGTLTLEKATAAAAAEGAALMLLWADDPTWYQERGWVPFGSENVFVVEQENAFLLPEPDGVRPIEAKDRVAVHELYCKHLSRADRTLEDTITMLGVPNMTTLVREHEGEIVGYACVGRGEDLGGVVHEWGGDPEGVLPIVGQFWNDLDDEAGRLFMMIPDTETDFLAYFKFVRAAGAKGILAMAKLANAEAAAQVISTATPDDVTARATGDDTIDVTGPSGTIRLTGHEILLALCPPRGDRRVTDVVESEIGVALPDLPLQPFVWGLDSI
ncbi:MAG: GNAT family N-acetyltransferase [Planctomycetota bacterium]